jgi:peptidoglycan hydrolase-like protein with peptidoglycan-binding domain
LQATVDAVRRPVFAGLLVLLALAWAPAVALADGGGAVAPATSKSKGAATAKKGKGKGQVESAVVLKRGDRGAAVRKLQAALELPVDGVFGPQTEKAVKSFQKRKGLTVDGIVGPDTRDALGLDPFAHGSVEHKPSSFLRR